MQNHSSISRRPKLGRALVALAVTGILGACTSDPSQGNGAQAAPQIPIATPLVQRVAVPHQFPARVEAVDRVELRPRVSGYVLRVQFREGSVVKAGKVLFEIDPRPYAARLAEADAALALARSDLALAMEERDRSARLSARNALPAEEHSRREAAATAASARVEAATAVRELAALDLSFTQVRAPITGRIGRAEVTPGNLVSATAGTGTLLATLVKTDPLYATFDVDERTAAAITSGSRSLPVRFVIAGAGEHEGTISFQDNELGRGTGTLRVRATLANPAGHLIPGMLGSATVAIDAGQEAVMIDDKAIGTDQGRRYVLVANDEGTLEYRSIEAGPLLGNLRVVKSGLAAQDRVVVNGLMRVGPGAVIEPVLVSMEHAAVGNYTPVSSSLASVKE